MSPSPSVALLRRRGDWARSIRPSIRYAGWRGALDEDPSALPSDQAWGWPAGSI
jgi:hypothetical protein